MGNVIFKYEKYTKEVYAILTDVIDNERMGFDLCISNYGIQSWVYKTYTVDCQDAIYSGYESLLKFMIGIGYKQLNVLNMQVITYHRPPTKFEIKQGYGALHYRDFLACDFINKSGNIKKWLKADDGLRYYR